jgi:CRP-like cAMP-binding protein
MEVDLILKNVAKHIRLTAEEQSFFTSLLVHKKLKRKELLIMKGQVARYTNFIVKGCLRNYEIDEKGGMHIAYFAMEDWWISDLHSFLTQTPSHSFVDAIEESELLCLSKENYELLFERVPKFERFFRILHQNAYVAQRNRIMDGISLTAEESYQKFVTNYPQFNNRIPQKQIAAYLGITPEFLSMIRSKWAKKR